MKPILDWMKSKAEAYTPGAAPSQFSPFELEYQRLPNLGSESSVAGASPSVPSVPRGRDAPVRPRKNSARAVALKRLFHSERSRDDAGWELHLPLSVSRGRLIENVRDAKKTIVIATA